MLGTQQSKNWTHAAEVSPYLVWRREIAIALVFNAQVRDLARLLSSNGNLVKYDCAVCRVKVNPFIRSKNCRGVAAEWALYMINLPPAHDGSITPRVMPFLQVINRPHTVLLYLHTIRRAPHLG